MAAAARPRRAAETTETRARVAKLGLDPELGAESSYRLPGARERRARLSAQPPNSHCVHQSKVSQEAFNKMQLSVSISYIFLLLYGLLSYLNLLTTSDKHWHLPKTVFPAWIYTHC